MQSVTDCCKQSMTRNYLRYTNLKEDKVKWCVSGMDDLGMCCYRRLGEFEEIPKHAYICMEVEERERRDWLSICWESRSLKRRIYHVLDSSFYIYFYIYIHTYIYIIIYVVYDMI